MLTLRSALVPALLAALSLAAGPARALDGQVRVVDGDSLEWQGQKVRLFGIDAPELRQTCDRNGQGWACGRWSAQMLAETLALGPLACRQQDTDRYGRIVAICTAGGIDLARAQVQAGAAQAYVRYSDRYLRDEARAKAAGAGLWAGRMVTPEAYRQAGTPAPQAPPSACAIKGNISASGHVYHRPGQRDYEATRISEAKGERWFCSAAEAEAAGFRAARR